MTLHQFHLQATWPGGRNEVGYLQAGNLKTEISIPREMNGPGEGTNPDEMLLGASSTCYLITLAAMIERAKLPLSHLSLGSVGEVDVTDGVFTYQKITHKPEVKLSAEATDKDLDKLRLLVEQAEASCMISRAINGNVEIELKPSISIV